MKNNTIKRLVRKVMTFLLTAILVMALVPTQAFALAIGDTFTGTANIGGGNYFDTFPVTLTINGRQVTATMYCLNPTAAAPSNMGGSYVATVTSIDWYNHRAELNFVVTPPNASTGAVDANGRLYGYQRVGARAWLDWAMQDPGQVRLLKVDTETSLSAPQGGASSFEGAEYLLTNTWSGQKWTMILNNSGAAALTQLPLADYTLVETKAPIGYTLDPTVHSFTIGTPESGTNTITITSRDHVIKGSLAIDKLVVGGEDPLDLAGIIFDLYSATTGLLVTSITTNSAGHAETPDESLVYDSYDIVERPESVPVALMTYADAIGHGANVVGRVAIHDEQQVHYEVGNYHKVGLKVQKADADTDEPVQGAEFTLYYVNPNATLTELDRALSDAAGTVSFADDVIDRFGTYRIEETLVPSGYMLPVDSGLASSVDIVVDEATFSKFSPPTIEGDLAYGLDTDGSPLITYRAYDRHKIGLAIKKADADTNEPVQGAEFALYYVNQDTSLTELGRTRSDASGDVVFADGVIDRFGTYRIEETAVPAGYMMPVDAGMDAFIDIAIDATTFSKCSAAITEGGLAYSYGATGVPLITYTAVNYRREIIVEKTDVDTGAPIGDTEFALYRYQGAGVPEEFVQQNTGGLGTVINMPADLSQWEFVGTGITDANGKLLFGGLVFGYYVIGESRPNPAYASNEESGTVIARYVQICAESTGEVQVFEDAAIQISCEVDKDTINVTSAAFRTLPGDYLAIDNIGKELYHYDLHFRSTSNVRADEFVVEDPLENVSAGQVRLEELFTPIAYGDTDGTFNLWYRTANAGTSLVDSAWSEANAMSTNPYNPNNPDNRQNWPSTGWTLWQANLPAAATTHLFVSDLGLAEGNYVTALRFEYGSVEVGFTTQNSSSVLLQSIAAEAGAILDWTPGDANRYYSSGAVAATGLKPATYLVSCPAALLPPTQIESSAQVYIARNFILTDVDADAVVTTVIEPFMTTPKSDTPTNLKVLSGGGLPSGLPRTGDTIAWGLGVPLAATMLLLAAALFLRKRINKASR